MKMSYQTVNAVMWKQMLEQHLLELSLVSDLEIDDDEGPRKENLAINIHILQIFGQIVLKS